MPLQPPAVSQTRSIALKTPLAGRVDNSYSSFQNGVAFPVRQRSDVRAGTVTCKPIRGTSIVISEYGRGV